MPIRPYALSDAAALYDICLRTGAAGEDASADYEDPSLLGHVYVGPYLALQPRLAYVVEDEEGVAGYVLGARDTRAFEAEAEGVWWPGLRGRYVDPPGPPEAWTHDQRQAHLIHHPPRTPDEVVADHPSHLHIDLLPRVQGRGAGRRLMETLQAALVTAGSAGVHLGVSRTNERAVGFYGHLGFRELQRTEHALWLGRRLP